jgi:MFS family permease
VRQTRLKEAGPEQAVTLGLRQNLGQFSLLVGVNALVGGMIGQERTVLPLLAARVYHLHAFVAALTFIVAFGIAKAATNFAAGTLADRIGRKPVLVAGWLAGIPVPLLLIWGPAWGYVIAANVLLGLAGVVADLAGLATANWAVDVLTALSGLTVAIRMYETRPARPPDLHARRVLPPRIGPPGGTPLTSSALPPWPSGQRT